MGSQGLRVGRGYRSELSNPGLKLPHALPQAEELVPDYAAGHEGRIYARRDAAVTAPVGAEHRLEDEIDQHREAEGRASDAQDGAGHG